MHCTLTLVLMMNFIMPWTVHIFQTTEKHFLQKRVCKNKCENTYTIINFDELMNTINMIVLKLVNVCLFFNAL